MQELKLSKSNQPAIYTNLLVTSARALGFEPRSKVLETSILPLNYARISKFEVRSTKLGIYY